MRKLNHLLLLATVPLLTAGCGVTVHNMTPQAMTRNPSSLYTIAVEVIRNDNSVVAGSVQPILITPDLSVPMVATPSTSNRWEYTVAVPANVNRWPYHFKINYTFEKALVKQEPRSKVDPEPPLVYVLRITDTSAVTPDARRGRVGSRIKILGRGFSSNDQVLLNGKPVPTRYESDSTLSFQVPPIEGNQAYPLEVSESGGTKLKCGSLLVDTSNFLTNPTQPSFALGSNAYLDIVIPEAAPPGGLAVRVEVTDASILEMPASVVVPEGQTAVRATVKAKHLGEGAIKLSAAGYSTAVIPYRIVVSKSAR